MEQVPILSSAHGQPFHAVWDLERGPRFADIDRYRDAYEGFENALGDFASERGSGLLRLDADTDVVGQLARLFEGGQYRL